MISFLSSWPRKRKPAKSSRPVSGSTETPLRTILKGGPTIAIGVTLVNVLTKRAILNLLNVYNNALFSGRCRRIAPLQLFEKAGSTPAPGTSKINDPRLVFASATFATLPNRARETFQVGLLPPCGLLQVIRLTTL